MLRTWLERTAFYFGAREDPDAVVSSELEPLRRALLKGGAMGMWMAVIGTASMVGLFGHAPGSLAAGASLGAVLFGGVAYVIFVRRQVPEGALQPPPPGVTWERAHAGAVRLVAGLVLVVPPIVGLAWIVDALGAGGVFIPGQPAGYGLASLIGAWQVARWERRHRSRIAFRRVGGRLRLYDAP